MNTPIIKRRRSREEKLMTRSTLWLIYVTGKRNPGKKYRLQKFSDIFPLLYEYVITSILFQQTTVLWIEHKLILIRTVRAPHVSLFLAWFQTIYSSFQLGENFKWLKEINNTRPSVQIWKWKKIKFVCTCLMFVTEECRGISKNISYK